jgi:hypothetical protein
VAGVQNGGKWPRHVLDADPDIEGLTVAEGEDAGTALAAAEAPVHETLRPHHEAAGRNRDRKRIEMVD